MSAALETCLRALAAGGDRALDVADAICGLVINGGKLGELDECQIRDAAGNSRAIKTMPRPWIDRVARAIEVGAFERLSADAIVERILTPQSEPAET